jgi:hypothetical protein
VSECAAEDLPRREELGKTVDDAATQPVVRPRSSRDERSSGGRRRLTTHLHSAARTLEQILGELYPEHDWVVTVGEVERADRQRDAAASVALDEAGPVADHPGPLADRHPPAAADGDDDHGLDQAA